MGHTTPFDKESCQLFYEKGGDQNSAEMMEALLSALQTLPILSYANNVTLRRIEYAKRFESYVSQYNQDIARAKQSLLRMECLQDFLNKKTDFLIGVQLRE